MDDNVLFVGISNTNNSNVIDNFISENNLSFPILYDPGSPGGVQGGNTYDLYYMPNDGSPYPRDFIVDQNGILAYANNEIDTEWMLSIIYDLIDMHDGILGDINQDQLINILDVVIIINFILSVDSPNDYELWASDLNQDNILNILDVVLLVNEILD